MQTETQPIEFTRVNSDVNGNPRYVCHFLDLLSDVEKSRDYTDRNDPFGLTNQYAYAVKKANKIGGRKFSNKQYGGGIVFQSYNIQDTERRIFDLLETGK